MTTNKMGGWRKEGIRKNKEKGANWNEEGSYIE